MTQVIIQKKVMKRSVWFLLLVCFAGLNIFKSCTTELGQVYKDPTKEQVYSYLKIDENKDEFSILTEAIDKSNLAGMLNSYGTYTLFAPTNEGFYTYFANNGISGLDDMDSSQVRDLIVYHILNNVRLYVDLSPGFSSDTTAKGDYLVFDMSKSEGSIWINSKSRINKADRRVLNGVVHHIDNVLIPPSFTIWSYLSSSSSYSIFTSALAETGNDTKLNVVDLVKRKLNSTFTVFAETDDVFRVDGINSLDDLKAEVANRGYDLTDFVNYHIIKDKKLAGAIFSFMIFNEGLLTLNGKPINANIDFGLVFNQWWESDGTYHAIHLNEEQSDIFAKNGVIQGPDKVMFIPEDLKFEPIIRQCESGIRYNENTNKYEVDEDSLVSWTPGTDIYLEANETQLRYDAIQKSNFIEFKLKNVIPGRYNVILGYVSNSAFAKVQLYIDGTPLGQEVDLTISDPTNEVVVGVKDFQSLSDHLFKFINLTDGDGIYDYIKLAPVEN